MAGSRLDRIGTIFSRACGLLRSGAVKYQDRPVWYDVYRIFPPKYEPHFDREPERTSEIPDILYKEDKTRAYFFKRFGVNPSAEVRHLNDLASEETSQLFVRRCQEIEKSNPEWSTDQVFEAAADAYQSTRPVYSTRSGTENNSAYRKDSSYQSYSQDLEENSGQDFEEKSPMKYREGKSKLQLITAESLRSLFEEAKDKQAVEKDSKTSSSTDEAKPKDSDKS